MLHFSLQYLATFPIFLLSGTFSKLPGRYSVYDKMMEEEHG